MWTLGRLACRSAAREAAVVELKPARLMVAPVPVDPLRRAVLLDLGGSYRWGSLDWRSSGAGLALDPDAIQRKFEDPRVARALEHPDARAFLGWSRFPAAAVTPGGVRLYDLRYADAGTDSWASVVIAE